MMVDMPPVVAAVAIHAAAGPGRSAEAVLRRVSEGDAAGLAALAGGPILRVVRAGPVELTAPITPAELIGVVRGCEGKAHPTRTIGARRFDAEIGWRCVGRQDPARPCDDIAYRIVVSDEAATPLKFNRTGWWSAERCGTPQAPPRKTPDTPNG